MEPATLGVVLDSSVLITAERRELTAAEAVESIQKQIGDVPLALSVVTGIAMRWKPRNLSVQHN